MITKNLSSRWYGTIFMCASVLFLLGGVFSGGALAATIDIEYTGLDVTYDGTDITDVDGGGGTDALTALVIELDGVQQGPVLTAGLSADLKIPDVLNLAVGGDSTTSSAGGFLKLDLGGGNSLDLTLGAVDVAYLDLGVFQFVFAASVASVSGQNLPLGLQIGSVVDMSVETRVNSFTDNGTDLLSFLASGTGSLSGDAVPEPSTIAMLLLASAGLMGVRRR